MRELKEAAIKKVFARESLEMKIITMQISTYFINRLFDLISGILTKKTRRN